MPFSMKKAFLQKKIKLFQANPFRHLDTLMYLNCNEELLIFFYRKKYIFVAVLTKFYNHARHCNKS